MYFICNEQHYIVNLYATKSFLVITLSVQTIHDYIHVCILCIIILSISETYMYSWEKIKTHRQNE